MADRVPADVISIILSYLAPSFVADVCRRVNKRWQRLSEQQISKRIAEALPPVMDELFPKHVKGGRSDSCVHAAFHGAAYYVAQRHLSRGCTKSMSEEWGAAMVGAAVIGKQTKMVQLLFDHFPQITLLSYYQPNPLQAAFVAAAEAGSVCILELCESRALSRNPPDLSKALAVARAAHRSEAVVWLETRL